MIEDWLKVNNFSISYLLYHLQGSRLLESNFINNTSMVFGQCLRVGDLNTYSFIYKHPCCAHFWNLSWFLRVFSLSCLPAQLIQDLLFPLSLCSVPMHSVICCYCFCLSVTIGAPEQSQETIADALQELFGKASFNEYLDFFRSIPH